MACARAVEGIAQHHEHLDGSGYPKGLKGDEIGAYGRMAAIADSFAALIAARSYANASAPQDALMNLYEWGGSSFDEPLVEQFVQAIGLFPVGSLVELSSGEVAVVLAQNRLRRLEPRVQVLTGADKVPIGIRSKRNRRQKEQDRSRNGGASSAEHNADSGRATRRPPAHRHRPPGLRPPRRQATRRPEPASIRLDLKAPR
jgi:hypothetical protein